MTKWYTDIDRHSFTIHFNHHIVTEFFKTFIWVYFYYTGCSYICLFSSNDILTHHSHICAHNSYSEVTTSFLLIAKHSFTFLRQIKTW